MMGGAIARVWLVLAVLVLAAGASGCGGSGGGASTGTPGGPGDGSGEILRDGVRGGTLTVYDQTDFEHLDPGQAYSALDYQAIYATQRPLYAYLPNQSQTLSPDLAAGPAQVSADGRTVTVRIKHGVHFSPPVNRAVTSADVAYAIERGANPNVANPYFPAYFATIVGAEHAHGGPIHGIVTPDPYTIVFHLSGPYGTFFASALSLPLTAPVPREFAAPLDAKVPTQYGSVDEVATGPYMLQADARGRFLGIGYQPGKSATLVRNPNWRAAGDDRPAYLDRIRINIGGDALVIGRQVLLGTHAVQNDNPAGPIVKLAYQRYPRQLVVVPGAGVNYVALNNTQGPFSNVNVRRALWAALDREAMIRVGGGSVVGALGTHFIYPGSQGYAEAGGATGPHVDYNLHPQGDLTLAAAYMRAAGFRTGKYTGTRTLRVVGATGSPFGAEAAIVDHTLQELGFKTNYTLVDGSVMYDRYCGVPAQEIDVCPNVGLFRDFADAQTILDATFAGYNVAPTNNSNYGQVDNPRINAAMRAAEATVGVAARTRSWATVDRMLVDDAVAVPWSFTKQPNIESHDVRGINDLWNLGAWDYAYTSLR